MSNYIEVNDDYVSQVLSEDVFRKAGLKFVEPVKTEEKPVEKVDEAVKPAEKTEAKEDHVCPLCESKLEKEIPDEKLLEHVSAMADLFDEVHQELLKEEAEGKTEAKKED